MLNVTVTTKSYGLVLQGVKAFTRCFLLLDLGL